MLYDQALISGKLKRWDHYLRTYALPTWEEIPDLGLYMEQLIPLMRGYLNYLPPELSEENCITAAAINNYVRKKIMPPPIKKRYYRTHIAYLLIICSLKQSLAISTLQTLIPMGLDEAELRRIYDAYALRHQYACTRFSDQMRTAVSGILEDRGDHAQVTPEIRDLIISSAVVSGFARVLAEKLLLLDGRTLEDGGSIELHE